MAEGLVLDHLRIRQGGDTLLSVDARIGGGEVLSLMGPSGSGKSTLLSHLMGSLPALFRAEGRVSLNGRPLDGLPPEARRIGILYQDPILFPHLSVAENLAFGLPSGGTASDRRAVVEEALSQISLTGFGPRDPATLSGGQAARVALMRVLLSQPEALLLDEPFAKLDTDLRVHMRRLVFDRARAARIPVLLVTHDLEDAQAAGEDILRL